MDMTPDSRLPSSGSAKGPGGRLERLRETLSATRPRRAARASACVVGEPGAPFRSARSCYHHANIPPMELGTDGGISASYRYAPHLAYRPPPTL